MKKMLIVTAALVACRIATGFIGRGRSARRS